MKKIAIFIASIVFVLSGFFLSPAPLVLAQTPAVESLNIDTDIENALSSGCKEASFFSAECALSLFYYIALQPSFWLVGLAANILDFFLGYSLDSNAYTAEFVSKGWALIRDISNVAFIFTLLYLAISHILGNSAKKAIPTLIIVALLINFSLFFTKVVIDAGNILARAFYNSIVIENDPNYSGGDEGYKSITLGLVDKINPQQLLSSTMVGLGAVRGEYNDATNQYEGDAIPVITGRAGIFFTIFILMIVVNLVLAWTFLSVALLFVGRVIGLWFSMIFSPIAFITLAVPGSAGFVKQMSFDTWKDTVIKLSFMAPIFIFFLYLTISFLSIFATSQIAPEGGNSFLNLMKIFIPFIFIIVLLQIAKKTATEMAGEIGGMVKSIVGKVAGVVAGAGLGATAFAGRKVVGAAARWQMKNGNYAERMANAKNPLSRWAIAKEMKTAKYLSEKATFDARSMSKNSWLAKGVGAATGGAFGDKFSTGKASKKTEKSVREEGQKERLQLAKDIAGNPKDKEKEILAKKTRDQEYTANKLELDRIKKEKEVRAERLKELNTPGFKSNEEMAERARLNAEISQLESREKPVQERVNETDKKYNDEVAKATKTSDAARERIAKDTEDLWFKGPGYNQETADKIRRREEPEDEEKKAMKAMKKYMESEQKSADNKDESKGSSQNTSAPQNPAPSSAGPAPSNSSSAGPNNSVDTNKIVDAIKNEGKMEKKRDMEDMKYQKYGSGGATSGGSSEGRNLAGFGNRGRSTPNEGSEGGAGFKK